MLKHKIIAVKTTNSIIRATRLINGLTATLSFLDSDFPYLKEFVEPQTQYLIKESLLGLGFSSGISGIYFNNKSNSYTKNLIHLINSLYTLVAAMALYHEDHPWLALFLGISAYNFVIRNENDPIEESSPIAPSSHNNHE